MAEMRFELDPELHTRFKLVCVAENVSMVGVVRSLIEEWVELKELVENTSQERPTGGMR